MHKFSTFCRHQALQCFRLLVMSITVIHVCSQLLHAQGVMLPAGTTNFSVHSGWFGAASFFSKNGSLIAPPIQRKYAYVLDADTLTDGSEQYTPSYAGYFLNVALQRGINDNLTLDVQFPLAYMSVNEISKTRDGRTNYALQTNSTTSDIFGPMWLMFGGRFSLYSDEHLAVAAGTHFRLPSRLFFPSLKNSSAGFWGTDEVVFTPSVHIVATTSFGWLTGKGEVHNRGGNYSNQVTMRLEAGFSTIPDTYLRLNCDIMQSVRSFAWTPEFGETIRYMPFQENYISLGGNLGIQFDEQWYAEAAYSVRVVGANTWSFGTVGLGIGMYFGRTSQEKISPRALPNIIATIP